MFTNPFYYEPSETCIAAATEVQKLLLAHAGDDFGREIADGKMFGVLIVKNKDGETSFLAGYSGQICGRSDWEGFVPAVFDYLQPDGYFKRHETLITAVNRQISAMENSQECQLAIAECKNIHNEAESAIDDFKQQIKTAKQKRDMKRLDSLSADEEKALIGESQFMKAELHRLKKHFSTLIAESEKKLSDINSRINSLKQQRRQMSDSLQNWLFSNFVMLNARGEQKNLIDIFHEYEGKIPPAGSGECCEPKLLQYAFMHNLKPISMAMFWWGKSPKQEIRHHLHYYPACNNKCKPILKWMLQGLEVAPNPLESDNDRQLEIIYEDEYIAVVNKPSGMLSVPGKSNRESVYSIMRHRYPDADSPLIVHRLDMDTSGIMIIARNIDAYRNLQQQFLHHEVKKQYVALLQKEITKQKGMINLPLRPDLNDRPRQLVDHELGKEAVTEYIKYGNNRIELFPHTGRTHQLRVHCAHSEGLDNPILGDPLYGEKADRLYLHAQHIIFRHPQTGKTMEFNIPAEF